MERQAHQRRASERNIKKVARLVGALGRIANRPEVVAQARGADEEQDQGTQTDRGKQPERDAQTAEYEQRARSGVAASALRFDEAKGLIRSERTAPNQRRYARSVFRRIAFIQVGRTALSDSQTNRSLPPVHRARGGAISSRSERSHTTRFGPMRCGTRRLAQRA